MRASPTSPIRKRTLSIFCGFGTGTLSGTGRAGLGGGLHAASPRKRPPATTSRDLTEFGIIEGF
jgi:hypothetical protein